MFSVFLQAPVILKKHFSKYCIGLSSSSSDVLKEMAVIMNTMTKSTKIDLMVNEMNDAVQELQGVLKSLSKQPIIRDSKNGTGGGNKSSTTMVRVMEIVPIVSISTLLIEIAARIEKGVEAINELANKAEFEEGTKKSKQSENQQNSS